MSTLINFIKPEYNRWSGKKRTFETTYFCTVDGEEIEKSYVYTEVQVGQLREIADALGYIIVPLEYTNFEEFLERYTQITSKDNDLRCCCKAAKERMTSCGLEQWYILSPICFYNPWKEINAFHINHSWLMGNHMTSEERKEIYFSNQLADVKLMLNLLIPSLRMMQQEIMANEMRIYDLSNALNRLEGEYNKTLYSLSSRINYIADSANILNRKIEVIIQILEHTPGARTRKVVQQSSGDIVVRSLFEGIPKFDITGAYGEVEPLEFNTSEIIVKDCMPEYYKFLKENLPYLTSCIVFRTGTNEIFRPDGKATIVSCFGGEIPERIFIEAGLTGVYDEVFDSVNHRLL